ncbi:MAG: nicotinic acid mononucleotide adenylyltransferase, partial [Proteobacteria bacterium]|nr:nicotinic acid mononucleotide adenylyltransferase [Pseudomonadota bacterium]
TVDTLAALRRRFPDHRFVWLMGADNLAQLHRWRQWRRLARLMPIAVIARPGYDGRALAAPAMAWLGRYRRPLASLQTREGWGAPALLFLATDPDPRSASALRRADPDWASRLAVPPMRDGVTFKPIPAAGG